MRKMQFGDVLLKRRTRKLMECLEKKWEYMVGLRYSKRICRRWNLDGRGWDAKWKEV